MHGGTHQQFRTDGQEYAGNLDRLTDARLYRTREPMDTATVRIMQRRDDRGPIIGLGDFGVGDTVRVVSPGMIDVDAFMRVVSQTVTVSGVGVSNWEVALAEADATTGGLDSAT